MAIKAAEVSTRMLHYNNQHSDALAAASDSHTDVGTVGTLRSCAIPADLVAIFNPCAAAGINRNSGVNPF